MSQAHIHPPSAALLTAEDWQRARSLHALAGPRDAFAESLRRLGLPTLADEIAGAPSSGPGDDRIDPDAFASAAETIALSLASCGILDQTVAAVALEGMSTAGHFRAADASRVWMRDDGTPGGLSGSVTEIAAMPPLVPDDCGDFPPASVLVGMDPPALLGRLWHESRPRANGYAPRMLVCEPDPGAALAALADIALRSGTDGVLAMLRDERAVWFIGADATDRLGSWLNERCDEALPSRVHVTPGGNGRVTAGVVAECLGRAHEAQRIAIGGVAAGRPAWAGPDGRPGEGPPRRVQIITSRYTNYVRFSAADLAAELGALGIEARVLQERDGSSHANPLYFARRIDAFRPDLVVCINYLRPHAAGAVPNHVPVVSWIQDAMPQLLSNDQAWRAGPRDFAAGFIYPALTEQFGFAPARTLRWTNPVSASKFHAGPVGPDHEHLRCEIAMATRHSEPPRAYFERGVRALGVGTPAGRAAQRIGAGIGPILDRAAAPWHSLNHELMLLTAGSLREALGAEPDDRAVSVLLNSFTLPLADLIFRQQAATWAGAITKRRGWRLHLYGRAWDEHPTLGEFGKADLTHGEELRAAYRLATVHLHASVRTPMHQRLAEISLSGGLPLVRRTFEDTDRSRLAMLHHVRANAPADLSMIKGRHPAYLIANHPEAMRVACSLGAIGLSLGTDGLFGMSPTEIEGYEALRPDQRRSPERDPNRLLVDTAETTFADEAELERCVELAMSRPRRDALSGAIARRCRERFGLDAFARALLAMVNEHAG